MLKPFPEAIKSRLPRTKLYNYKHATTRVVVENAFGRLKGKWARVTGMRTSSVERARLICRACFVLHNFTIRHAVNEDEIYQPRLYKPVSCAGNGIKKREEISKVLK